MKDLVCKRIVLADDVILANTSFCYELPTIPHRPLGLNLKKTQKLYISNSETLTNLAPLLINYS